MPTSTQNLAYWKANLRLITHLLIIWFLVSFGAGILFVDFLDQFYIAGVPLGFWFSQQGSIYVFILITVYYTYRMNQLDKVFNVEE